TDFIKGLPEMYPRAIAVDSVNSIWLGTRYDGLYHIKLNGSKLELLKHYSIKEGLTDNFIYAITCDRENNLWVGTQSGLDKIMMSNNNYFITNISKNNNIFQAVYNIIV